MVLGALGFLNQECPSPSDILLRVDGEVTNSKVKFGARGILVKVILTGQGNRNSRSENDCIHEVCTIERK